MREYHIYMQRTKRTEWHCDYSIYKWLPWEYVGHVKGTKELHTCFKLKFHTAQEVLIFTIHSTILIVNMLERITIGILCVVRMNITDI